MKAPSLHGHPGWVHGLKPLRKHRPMIQLAHGDILKQEAEALVNTVNCMGVMGRGIALQFRRAFQDNYEAYRGAAKAKEIRPGRMFVFERPALDLPRWIINFPTKRHWKGRSRIEDIEAGLVDLVRVIREEGIRSITVMEREAMT